MILQQSLSASVTILEGQQFRSRRRIYIASSVISAFFFQIGSANDLLDVNYLFHCSSGVGLFIVYQVTTTRFLFTVVIYMYMDACVNCMTLQGLNCKRTEKI
jgi:hypothetical protein